MQVKISEFLKEYTSELPESVLSGEIFKLTYTENLEAIRFHARFDEVVPSDDIFAFEKAVEAAIKVEQVRLACRYPSGKFGMDCYGELIKLLKRDIPVVNGFLDDADVSLGNGELRIRIVHGGRDILDKFNFCTGFSRMIYNQFGVKVKVVLDGENNISEQQFDEMIERIEADMPDYSSQLIPDKTPDEIRAEEMKSVIPTVTIDVTALDKDFDAESAEIVKGKA
ncbi:MAG: PolC-type DNA polymerase III, partial [Ruminococcus sp.]|nr:PolC-type DNA polymerase III [Ruminococcus sp.]